ncbi:MAG: ABC transporter permease [Lachnospiraceae bacterium]|nr:ABC transporter permease [Lachnospiraceae bacterium]
MRNLMLKILFPIIGISLWIAVCYPICNRPEGFKYFMFWIIAGLPFGIRFMCLKLIPKGYGLTGAIGVFALNAVIGGLIGGAMLMVAIVKVFMNMVKLVIGKAD